MFLENTIKSMELLKKKNNEKSMIIFNANIYYLPYRSIGMVFVFYFS